MTRGYFWISNHKEELAMQKNSKWIIQVTGPRELSVKLPDSINFKLNDNDQTADTIADAIRTWLKNNPNKIEVCACECADII